MKYLITAEPIPEGIKLLLWNQTAQRQEVNIDPHFRPYFYLPHPIPRPDNTLLHELEVKLSTVTKRDFFTGDPVTVTKVEYAFSDSSMKPFSPFTHVWEREVSLGLSYVYDHELTFGSEYSPSNSHTYSSPQHLIIRLHVISIRVHQSLSHSRQAQLVSYSDLLS